MTSTAMGMIECGSGVWVSVVVDQPYAGIRISQRLGHAAAWLDLEAIDALIRALAAARVEITKEPPK